MERFKPTEELRKNILLSITKKERCRARNFLATSLVVASASLIGAILSIRYAIKAFAHSSFYQYFSLLFSDSDIILSSWKEFSFSLVESLPFFAISLVLSIIIVFMTATRVFINNSGKNFKLSFS